MVPDTDVISLSRVETNLTGLPESKWHRDIAFKLDCLEWLMLRPYKVVYVKSSHAGDTSEDCWSKR